MIEYEKDLDREKGENIFLDGRYIGSIWITKYGYQCQLTDLGQFRRCECFTATANITGKTKEEVLLRIVEKLRHDAEILVEAAGVLARGMEQ